MPPVNNITRMLDAKKVDYAAYETPAEKLGALETARFLNLPPEQVFKTIVVARIAPRAKPILALIPAPNKVDLKLLAAVLNEKKVVLTTQTEAEALTGLQAGGISPLALIHKGFQTVIDTAAKSFTHINVSGGQRGINISIRVEGLAKLVNARFGVVSQKEE